MDLLREISTICLVMTLDNAEQFVRMIDANRLTPTEYVDVLGAAAGRIGGCSAYDPALAAAAAARVAMRVGAVYDRTNGEQTLVLTKLVTRYLRYTSTDYRQGAEVAGLSGMLKLWTQVWHRAEAAIDPQWQPSETFAPFDPGRPHEVIEGQTPESVRDPALRALYTEHLARKARYLQRMRDQTLLRRGLDEARDDYVAYAAYLGKIAGLRQALDTAAAAVNDPALKASLSH